jgi:hypothetical protein
MANTLDPQNPTSNFTKEGGETHAPGAVLTLTDAASSEFVSFFASDTDASPGTEIDVITTFTITQTAPNNADAGNRIVINDGASRAAIAACIVKNGERGIGLLAQGAASDPASYPVFVAVDWQLPTTLRLRRTASGDAELIEVNGVTPVPRAILTGTSCCGPTRGVPSVEFGARSVEAQCTVEYSAFKSEAAVVPVAGSLAFTRFRIKDADSADRIVFRADYTLGASSNGINPAGEPVSVKLSTPGGGQFYPAPDFNPVNGFTEQRQAPRRRWTVTDAERGRTGLEQLLFDEDPNNTGSVTLRDLRTDVPVGSYATVNVEITVGTGAAQDKLTGTVNLVERPAGSGRWRLG